MSGSEQHFTFRWKIESKPEGGFIARADDPADTIEAATREEVEARIKEKIAAALGPDIASKLDFSQPGTQVTTRIDKKVFSLGKPGQEGMSIRIGGSDAPPAIDADSVHVVHMPVA